MKVAILLLIAAAAILTVMLVVALCRTSRDEESGIIDAKLKEYRDESRKEEEV